jgi:hypothetical protein
VQNNYVRLSRLTNKEIRDRSISSNDLSTYLSKLYCESVNLLDVWELEEKKTETFFKSFGYGIPYVIKFKIKNEEKKIVLKSIHPIGGFSHDYPSDRAQILLRQHAIFNKLPKHVNSIDVGALTTSTDNLKSLGNCQEFFIITEFVEGDPYYHDLDHIKKTGKLNSMDEKRCLALSDYLVEIHKVKFEAPHLYVRRTRELLGHGEGIMGLLDSFQNEFSFITEREMIEIEKKCVVWRWNLKSKGYRLSQVHGDFHPGNIKFRESNDFTVFNRSRGEWGEPADDVAAITINYIFYSFQKHGEFAGVFERLFRLFFENYLKKTKDVEILTTSQPFFAWRGLIIASPIWYPNLNREVRKKMFNFVKNTLKCKEFNFEQISLLFSNS